MTPNVGLQLRSTVTSDGRLELTLVDEPVVEPGEHDVVVRVEATPINPSDLGLLLAGADLSSAVRADVDAHPSVTATIDAAVLATLAGRLDTSMRVGNEGAGTVVATGPGARELLGRTVAVAGGSMYAQYRTVDASLCLVLPEGTPARAGASAFVNPMTALGMLETMRLEGHGAIVHTAAASNLGQMLVRLCQAERVPLVNVVRRPEQAALLASIGAQYVCDSSAPTFEADLAAAVAATSATIAFDATGGGTLASQILTAMEAAAVTGAPYSRYGSSVHKQVYVYGGLDRGPTVLTRSFGFAWGVGGWLLTPFLGRIGPEAVARLRQRVADDLTTTFASSYSHVISLSDALDLAVLRAYARQATGEKYLIEPHRG